MRLSALLSVLLLAPLGSVAAERLLEVDSAQSHIDIRVQATVDSFTGSLRSYVAQVRVNEAGDITGAEVSFRFADVITGKEKRDRAMHEWQHTDEFPTGKFMLTSLRPDGAGSATATGQLTLHGVTRAMSFPVMIAKQDSTIAIDGDAPIDTREFGLPVIRLLGLLKVDPIVRVHFHLQGRRSA